MPVALICVDASTSMERDLLIDEAHGFVLVYSVQDAASLEALNLAFLFVCAITEVGW